MPSYELLLAFVVATAVFAYMPGPAMLYTAAQTIARGRRAGLMAALGIHIGGYVHVIAAAFGLSAIFKLVPEAYMAVKIIGAFYLIWLGIGIIRQRIDGTTRPQTAAKSARRAFFESITVEVLNPKAAIFFLAFLPQFVDPAAAFPVWVQFLILGTVVNLAFSSADLVCILLASTLVKRLKNGGWGERLARWTGGALLIGLGARLAFDRD
ncbi:MAG: LysE family translocator [Pseudomonadota bacterium]